MGRRGELTGAVQDVAERVLGRPLISRVELRLYPYIDFVMKNHQYIEPEKVSVEEREILKTLREEGRIEGGASGLSITRDFYVALQSILWVAYVVQGSEEHNFKDEAVLAQMMGDMR